MLQQLGVRPGVYPTVENWSFPCKFHYWIRNGKVRWAGMWTQEEIDAGRAADRMAKQKHLKRPFWRKLKWW